MMTERAVKPSQETRLAKSSASRDAALRGASLAFSKPPVKPKPLVNTYTGSNGALAAATKVGGGRGAPQRAKQTSDWRSEGERNEQALAYQNTGGSIASTSRFEGSTTTTSRPRMSRLDSTGFLQPPGQVVESARSPSFIAATLAASRSASVSPSHTGRQLLTTESNGRIGVHRHTSPRRSSSRESTDHVLDTTPIPPTTSLIGMFEKNMKSADVEEPQFRRTATLSARSPPDGERRATPRRTHTSQSPLTPKSHSSPTQDNQLRPNFSLNLHPNSHQPRPSPAGELGDSQPKQPPRPVSVPPKPAVISSKPIKIHHTEKQAVQRPEYTDRRSSSNDSFISATTDQTGLSFRATLANKNRHLTSPSAMSLNAAATVDSMANAIVASSLASSRAASPSKQLSTAPPPPRSRRSPHSHAHLFHNSKELPRTPSPSKQATLRTTMRKPKLEEEVDEGDKRRSKKHIMKKHPNKHHEGDRKRWRDEITERERKRYEAVWASNKGLHIYPAFRDSEYCVCNLVVRDIFSRSRLNEDVLEEVYALVDRSQRGALEKEEFVVGMWLIDQRLKGRKLPLRVSDHVWRSVGSLGGIKVRKAGK